LPPVSTYSTVISLESDQVSFRCRNHHHPQPLSSPPCFRSMSCIPSNRPFTLHGPAMLEVLYTRTLSREYTVLERCWVDEPALPWEGPEAVTDSVRPYSSVMYCTVLTC
jgi:hypothetical protein